MKRIRLISAAFGSTKKELSIKFPLIHKDYIIDQAFYNDQNYQSRKHSLNPRLKGKIPKMMEWLSHPNYDYYIWVDSKFTLLEGFIEKMIGQIEDQDANLLLFSHIERSSIKEEMDFMMEKMRSGSEYILSRYDGEILEDQVNRYIGNENFKDCRLFNCGLFLYKKKLVINRDYNLMTDWLMHCVLYNIQDQLWLPYLLYKHQVNYKIHNDHMIVNDFVRHADYKLL
ncbi:glycosyltransferase domain-containing protein [Pedobacter sp. AW31-3R]|uniref:glycosyltransferase domain-containing protein n=1 Tax=Pedobacter sp. AW31-3R TaxID=3445781 RepID=UPI003FA0AA59